MLMAGGLVLLGWGGWIFYQQQLEASQPPPARIVEMSLDDLETPTVRPVPTETEPAATRQKPTGDTLVLTATPTDTPEVALTPPQEPEPEPTAAVEAVAETPPTEPAPPPAEPTIENVLSLADNPLVVEQPEGTETTAAESVSDQSVPAAPSPLSQIVAESIGMDAPVIEVGWEEVVHNGQTVNVWNVADYAAGWHKNSMLPGQGGNIVLSGHHNIKGEVFRDIVELEPGAIISLYMDGQRYDYAVADKFIVKDKGEPDEVRRANARWIGPFNEERVTLVTCWPYNNNTHRVIVIAKPV